MSNPSNNKIKIVELTDLHIGRINIPPEMVRQHLVKYLYPKLVDADILDIGGDFFDCLCNLNNDAGIVATIIVDELIEMALEHKFYIRVVRGTFSHDRFQNRLFLTQRRSELKLGSNPLVKVVDRISIEVFEDLKISVLYCPDDQPYTDVTQTVLDVIEAHKLKKVDFIFSHGYFEHLLPKGLTKVPHNTLYYDRLKNKVAGAILNGHVHTPSVYEKVFNGGSFERLQHGEEENKGFFVLTYDVKSHKLTYEFIVNQDAIPFVTIDVNKTFTVETALEWITKKVDEIRKERKDPDLKIFLRLAGNSEFVALYVRENFPNVVLTTKSTPTQIVDTEELNITTDDLPIITEDNLPLMVEAALAETDTPLTVDEIKDILNDTTN